MNKGLNQLLQNRDKIQTLVLAPGCYDLLHYGHLRYLQEAKKLGDALVVAVSADHVVDKGINRPVFPVAQRAEMLAEFECVDYVIINNDLNCSKLIEQIKPNILVKGEELRNKSTPKLESETQTIQKIGGKVIFLPTQHSSSSMLINDYLCNLPQETCKYLQNLKKQYSFDQIAGYIDQLANIQVPLIGEVILDEYVYGETIGKSSKNPTLVMMTEKTQWFAGGSVAVANHLAQLCKNVHLISCIGHDEYADFILSKIAGNVDVKFVKKLEYPTIKKTRFIDSYYKSRLFETNTMNPNPINDKKILSLLNGGDEIIIADFGHGLMTPNVIQHVYNNYEQIFVNVQCNSANFGYNFIDKYKWENRYVSIDTVELRLLQKEKYKSLKELIHFSNSPQYMSVTEGKQGATLYEFEETPKPIASYSCPAMCNTTVDTIGAGDAYFAITSLLIIAETPKELIPFIGNVAAAIAANILGNEKAVSKEQLLKNIEILLK